MQVPPETTVPSSAKTTAPEGTQVRHLRLGVLTVVPAFAWWTAFLVLPIGLILATAFFRAAPYGGVEYTLNIANFTRALDPLYIGVLQHSVVIALITTVICLILGYPTAWFIATRPTARLRMLLLALVILPFWTNFLIRTYAWMILLNREGVVNGALRKLGVIDQPISLLYNDYAVILGLVYGYLPLMVLPLYAALDRINPEMLDAARDLGARPARVIRTVTLPLVIPGIVAGSVFVFVPSIGNIPVPDLLGGGHTAMIGNVINDQFMVARDWPFGSALVLMLMLVLMVLLIAQAYASRRSREIVLDE